MRALTSLNLSSNNLEAEGGKIVAEAIKVTNCAIAVVLVPFSCPSNHWINCCCLLLSQDNGVLTSLDISDNNMYASLRWDAQYATDTTGMCVCVAPKIFSDAMMLQVLQPLPMPSVTTGR
jgi:hypothetical protein